MEKENYFRFATEYVSEGKRYGENIFAKNRAEAEKLLMDKKLTERIVGHDPDTIILFD